MGGISSAWTHIINPKNITIGNLSMDYDTVTERYYKNLTFDVRGTHRLVILANDSCDNWNSISGSFLIAQEPTQPQNLNAFTGDSYINLTWIKPSDDGGLPVTNYQVYRGTKSGSLELLVEIGNATFYNDTSVKSGSTYYYQIQAKNEIGESSSSNEIKIRTHGQSSSKEDDHWWLGILLLLIIVIFIVLFLFNHKKRGEN